MRHEDGLRELKRDRGWDPFWRRVNFFAPGGCWIWRGKLDPGNGYARPSINGVPVYAHRRVWELNYGPIPNGALVLHRCGRKNCLKPDHLYLGTHSDNMADALRDGALRGGRLDAETAIAIVRFRFESGWSYLALADRFGVSPQSIANVCRGRTWSRATGIEPALPM